MSLTSFAELYEMNYHLERLTVTRQTWHRAQKFTTPCPRRTDGLFLLRDCDAILEQNGEVLTVPAGALVHLAANATYTWQFMPENELCHPLLLDFSLYDSHRRPLSVGQAVRVLSTDRCEIYEKHLLRLLDEFNHDPRSPSAIKAEAYRLISDIAKAEAGLTEVWNDRRLIARGIELLENDPFDKRTITELARMCNISLNYFERLFCQCKGETPTEYRTKRRVEHAKLLIAAHAMTLEQIAEQVGFSDSAYLCRVFKKKTGLTPKQYQQLHAPGAGDRPAPASDDQTIDIIKTLLNR